MDEKRLKTLLSNAIVKWAEDNFYEYEDKEWKKYVLRECGMTEKEFNEIMEEL